MFSLCQSVLIHSYPVPVHNSVSAVWTHRNIPAQIECRPPCIRELRAFLAHDVIPQTVMGLSWIYGLNIRETLQYGRLSAWDRLRYFSRPLASKMAGAHHQHSRWMPVFHDVWNCCPDEGFPNTHLTNAHHAVPSPQGLNRGLDGISLRLERCT